MNFIVNLVAAIGIGFSVFQYAAGEQALGAAGALLCCLVVFVNERNAAKRARREAAAPASFQAAAPAEPLRDEVDQLRRRVDQLERAVLTMSAR